MRVTLLCCGLLAAVGCGTVAEQPVDAGPEPSCSDGIQNPGESDVDCGGSTCTPCADGKQCTGGPDCDSQVCDPGRDVCISSCQDGVSNGAETGVDCGGGQCPACGIGGGCTSHVDCASGSCSATGQCVAASCDDGERNQDETDVDCGGSCGRCDIAKTCQADTDCSTYKCDTGDTKTCVGLRSCAELRAAGASSSRQYVIDPDGPGSPEPPLTVYCDMDFDGGGWTLVMSLVWGNNTFGYEASYWTTEDVINETNPMPTPALDAKYLAFNKVKADEIRAQWTDPDVNWHWPHNRDDTALQLFNLPMLSFVGGIGDNVCHPMVFDAVPGYDSAFQVNAQGATFFGINGTHSNGTKLRFGFGSNDEPAGSNWGASQAVGFSGANLRWEHPTDCDPGGCACWGTAYTPSSPTVYLWVR